jgi:hypothetical protein
MYGERYTDASEYEEAWQNYLDEETCDECGNYLDECTCEEESE